MDSNSKPKVLHIINSYNNGGAEVALVTLARNGFYEPFDTHLLALRPGNGNIQRELTDVLGEEHVSALSPGWNGKMSGSLWNVAKGVHRAISDFKPDTVILSLTVAGVVGRAVAAFHPDIKVATFEHNTRYPNRWVALAMKATSRFNAVVLGDSEDSLKAMRPYYPKKDATPFLELPIFIAERGVPRTAETPAHFKLLAVGRLEDQKNFPELIKAVSLLVREGRSLDLTIAGEGSQRPVLENMVRVLHLDKHIAMPGWVQDRTALNNAAHIYVHPAKYEGLCLAMVESLSAGLPTVSTNVGGMRDYGVHGGNMLKTKDSSAAEIANSLRIMMDNYGTIAAPMSQTAISSMQRLFGEDTVKKKWVIAAEELATPRSVHSSLPHAQRPDAGSPSHPYPQPRK